MVLWSHWASKHRLWVPNLHSEEHLWEYRGTQAIYGSPAARQQHSSPAATATAHTWARHPSLVVSYWYLGTSSCIQLGLVHSNFILLPLWIPAWIHAPHLFARDQIHSWCRPRFEACLQPEVRYLDCAGGLASSQSSTLVIQLAIWLESSTHRPWVDLLNLADDVHSSRLLAFIIDWHNFNRSLNFVCWTTLEALDYVGSPM